MSNPKKEKKRCFIVDKKGDLATGQQGKRGWGTVRLAKYGSKRVWDPS